MPTAGWRWLLILGTIPAAIIGFVGEDFIDEVFHGDSDEIRLAIAGVAGDRGRILVAADWLGAERREIEQVGRAGRRWRSASARRWPCCRASAAPARPSAPAWRWD